MRTRRPLSLLVTILLLLVVGNAFAQQLAPKVIATSGGYATNSSCGSLSYTVGEMAMVKTFSSNGNILTQGFQQPTDSVFTLGLIDLSKSEDGNLAVYPNPASSVLWLGYEFTASGHIEVLTTDIAGQQLPFSFKEDVNANSKTVHRFDCTSLSAGNYLFTVRFSEAGTHAIKVFSKKFQVIH